MDWYDFIRREGAVISQAPFTFLVAGGLIAGAVWWGSTSFYKEEVAAAKGETASAKQETATVSQQRDLFKARLDLMIAAPPASLQSSPITSSEPTEKKTPIVVERHKSAYAPVLTSSKPLAPDPTGNNVTSYYQSGGITARTVNVGPQPRVLRDSDKRALLDRLPKDKPIGITALMGDGEAISLATDIYAFLKANGFKMADAGISQGVFSGPVNGVQINLGGSKISIVVGANLPPRAS